MTQKQKREWAQKYLRDRSISFGNSMADERAEDMLVDALSHNEEMYEFTLSQFKDSWLIILKATWDEMFKYLNNKI